MDANPNEYDNVLPFPHRAPAAAAPLHYSHPAEQGEVYVAVMRRLAEDTFDFDRTAAHFEDLDRICRPFYSMSADELVQVLEGLHDGLQELLNELIVDPIRQQSWTGNLDVQ